MYVWVYEYVCINSHPHTHTHTHTLGHLVCRVVAFSMQVTRPCQPFAIVLLAFWFIDLNFSLLDFPLSLSPPGRPLLLAAQSLLFLILRFLCFRLFKYRFFLASSSCSCSSSCSWFRSSYFDRLLFGSRSFRYFGGLGWGLEFGFRFMFFFFCHPRQTSLTVTLACALHTHNQTHTSTHTHISILCVSALLLFL